MRIKIITTVLVLMVSFSAAADFRTVAIAYEIALSDLRVPVTSSGSLIFKQCADCDNLMVPMTSRTQFIVNDQDVGIKEFRKSVFRVQDRHREPVIVKHNLESNTITSLRVTL